MRVCQLERKQEELERSKEHLAGRLKQWQGNSIWQHAPDLRPLEDRPPPVVPEAQKPGKFVKRNGQWVKVDA